MTPQTIWGPAGIALALTLSMAHVNAQPGAGPFAAMAGNWSGGGTLTLSNGAQERLRCRANYAVGQGGDSLRLGIRCASDQYKFDLASNVANKGGRVAGEWSESSRNVSGTISGRASGDRIQALANSDTFSANLSLTTQGNRQSVAIRPQGTEIQSVSVALSRQ